MGLISRVSSRTYRVMANRRLGDRQINTPPRESYQCDPGKAYDELIALGEEHNEVLLLLDHTQKDNAALEELLDSMEKQNQKLTNEKAMLESTVKLHKTKTANLTTQLEEQKSQTSSKDKNTVKILKRCNDLEAALKTAKDENLSLHKTTKQ